ncbi:patatin-like phospholipase family protein [Candidatus Nitrososphaera evergladensis]|uniref:patatin-like phospholipase family protein n=1 Tax=Candidatus Nitrososphaera evergladensis TaxID=1459637 RepID=UPI00130DBFA2|nr:patatin-like phospholipase family protein [Candidatus Nitrososphaera evergladensis]
MSKKKLEKVLILQGGGSLGAFGCGVFKALAKSKEHKQLDIVAGTSIGGVNASIIAGSKEDHPEKALEQFWLELAEENNVTCLNSDHFNSESFLSSGWLTEPVMDPYYVALSSLLAIMTDDPRPKSLLSFIRSAVFGNNRMFSPRWSPDYIFKDPQFFTPKKWTYLYDLLPLEKTLAGYIDYNKLRPTGNPNSRLIMTATNVLTAEPITFDSSKQQITSKHILATSAYPLYYFPWMEVEKGLYCWDGGLLSNTPLREVIDASPIVDKEIFLVENYPKHIASLPQNLPEAFHRARDIIFSDKTLHNVKMSKVITQYLRFIDELYQIIEGHVDKSKMDKETLATIKRKYKRIKQERGAEIKRVYYISRKEKYPHVYENADFTMETIRTSIQEGELAAKEALQKIK